MSAPDSIELTLPDGSVRTAVSGSTALDVAREIGPGLAKAALGAELDGRVVGVTYSSFYRPKPAYRSTAETTIVLDTDHLGRGLGSALLETLLARLRDRGFHRAVAIVALPNDASVALHQKLGYRIVGTLSEVGHKLDGYWGTMLLEAELN